MTLRQNDQRWGSIMLGDGPSTIGRSGCLLVCVVEAARYFGTRPDLLPPHLNEAARQAGAFVGDKLIVGKAAELVGLDAPADKRMTVADGPLADALLGVLGKGCAVVHVDHDGQRADGDPEGDHFLLAVKVVHADGAPPHVECCDPATGVLVWLSLPDLEATARWGKVVKRYRAVSVRPIGRAS